MTRDSSLAKVGPNPKSQHCGTPLMVERAEANLTGHAATYLNDKVYRLCLVGTVLLA